MDFTYENEAYFEGFTCVCGIDEAGRGPLAGPVYAAAVILPYGYSHDILNDSKKLSEKKRGRVFEDIIRDAAAYCIATASESEIDELNILNATLLAMRRAVSGLSIMPDLVYVDGDRLPKTGITERAIVKGDSKCMSIAAASVLAKVARDRYMCELAKRHPEYHFNEHKGYGTVLHYQMIEKYGTSPVHRKTFLKNLAVKGSDR